jgi:hypothetical protein
VLIPAVLIDIDDITTGLFHRRKTISFLMSPILVVIALIFVRLVLQVRHSPIEGVIQQFPPNAADQFFLLPQMGTILPSP